MALTQIIDAMIAGMSASKLSGQVPKANAPSGSVIQVVTSQNTNAVTVNTDGITDIGVSASITIQQNSRILVDAMVPIYTDVS